MTTVARRRLWRVSKWVLGVGLALVAIYAALRLLVFDVIRFAGDQPDMWPEVGPGALVVVNRRATPARGDLVVLDRTGGGFLLRRVVALPGETVASLDGQPFVDGLADPARVEVGRFVEGGREYIVWRETLGGASWPVLDDTRRRLGNTFARPIDGYWVLADNRDQLTAKDSREFGPVPPGKVRGVVSWIVGAGRVPYVGPPGPTSAALGASGSAGMSIPPNKAALAPPSDAAPEPAPPPPDHPHIQQPPTTPDEIGDAGP